MIEVFCRFCDFWRDLGMIGDGMVLGEYWDVGTCVWIEIRD